MNYRFVSIGVLTLLLGGCPWSKLGPSPSEINLIAIDEAGRSGKPGTLGFTVALRRAIANHTGNSRLANLPTRRIEKDARFQKNLDGSIRSNPGLWIFNGTEVPALDTNYGAVVAITPRGGGLLCTGIAVSPTKIVTAGHCLDGREIHEGNSLPGRKYMVKAFAEFDKGDLGLLFLESPGIASKAFFQRATTSEVRNARSMRAMGYGMESGGKMGRKEYTDVTVDSSDCSEPGMGIQYACSPTDEMVADNIQHESDTCVGDSGGPAFIPSAGGEKVAAVILRGVKPGIDCVSGSVYLRLDSAAVEKFIKEARPLPIESQPLRARRQ
jgi:hypothetical protein